MKKHWFILNLVMAVLVLGVLVGLMMVDTIAADPTPGIKIQIPRIDVGDVNGTGAWETWIQVQNVGTVDTGAIFLGWGEYSGVCPTSDPGVIVHYCELIPPNAAWPLKTEVSETVKSGIIYAVREDVFNEACASADWAERDTTRWRCWKQEWEDGGCPDLTWGGPAGAQGEDIAVTVNRYGPNDYGTFVSSTYTGISEEMEGEDPPYNYYAPCAMKSYLNQLDTEMTIQNSGQECTSVWIDYMEQGTCNIVYTQHIEQLAPGEAVRVKVPTVPGKLECDWPGWLGSAHISAEQPLGIILDQTSFDVPCCSMDRRGLMTARVEPYDDKLSGFELYGPMIFREISGWDSTVNVHNLNSTSKTWVRVKFLDATGGSILSLSDWVCPNGSTSFYLLASTDLGVNYVGAVTIESLEREGTVPQPISAIVNMNKADNSDTPYIDALGASYNAIPLSLVENVRTIALPFLANAGTVSAIGIRNNNNCNRLAAILDIYDDDGLLASVPISIDPEEVEYVGMDLIGGVPLFVGSGILHVSVDEMLCGEEVPGSEVPMPSVVVININTGIGTTGDIINAYEGIVAEVNTPTPTVTATPTATPTATDTPTPTCTPSATPTSTPTPTNTPAPVSSWTVMIYLNGDNNLDAQTAELFNRLELAVASEPSLIVRALWDRSGNGDTVLYQVQPDTRMYALADYIEGQTKWSQGELDMGDPATLHNFIVNATQELPAEYYFLAIVNHGGGWSPELPASQRPSSRYVAGGSGFSWDWTNDHHYLSTKDMGGIFSQIEDPIDVVFYDACLMAMLEEAYEIRNGAYFLVASQNETWSRFPYDDYLVGIQSRTPSDQATWIVDRHYASLPHWSRTMAALDLQRTGAVSMALDNLAIQLFTAIPTHTEKIKELFLATQKLDYNYDDAISDTEGYVDLGDFAARLIDEFPGTGIASTAEALLDTLNGYGNPMVIHERHASGIAGYQGPYVDLDGVTGLSVYLPLGEEDLDLPFYLNSQIALANDTCWDEFIFNFLNKSYPQHPPDSPGGRGANPQPLTPPSWVFLPIVIKGP
jgi:hypothetical protein